MQEIIDAAQESTNVSAKFATALIGAGILSLGIIDVVLFAPDDTMPFPVCWADEFALLGTGLLLIHQSGAINEFQKLIP